jgi:LPS-assembly lipoprotein
LALSGCGFTPMYGNGNTDNATPVSQKMEQVQVQNIPERTGQLLRLSLQNQFYRNGMPTQQLYLLSVSYNINVIGIGIQSDTSTTRERFIGTAHWSLAPIGAPSQAIASGTATTEDAANIIDQQYFALTLETSTVDQELADVIAQQIADQVAAYFKTTPNTG